VTTSADILDALLADAPDLSDDARAELRAQAKTLAAIATERREINEAGRKEDERHEGTRRSLATRMVELTKRCPHPKGLIQHYSGQYEASGSACELCGKDLG
jgi:DNA repair exonuclease SbcCD ATPase subunit